MKRSALTRIAATAAVGLGLSGVLLTQPANAATSCTFAPTSLTANTLDHPWPDNYDEIRLSYGSVRYRHDRTFKGQLLNSGLPSVQFTQRLSINLTELDGGVWWNPDDNLGTFSVDAGLQG